MVVFALKIGRRYMYGVCCEIYSDHMSPECIISHIDLNSRQRRWIEILKDYDLSILYHSGNVNMVTDAYGGFDQGILQEAHDSRYFIYSGTAKMYRDIRQHYWWSGMRRDIPDYLSSCQHVKAEHLRPGDCTVRGPTWLRCRSLIGLFESTKPRPCGIDFIREALAHEGRDDLGCGPSLTPEDLDDHLTFVEEPIAILVIDVWRLRSRAIPIVNVRWRHRLVEEAT
ncbi:hypothetical protein MTR67_007126 [Solanum verrucosum]|uniref:Integrase zinc-binding domain-containing protein n=1 Tax=Solanum verrucosum TaxID=315347 RepID=A0AAF0PZC6_SOLVR|nr:hypothetical protein MTR67_007126 [Solanum verrucosum]